MINVTMMDIVNSVPVFEQVVGQEINGRLAFKLARLVRELDKELKLFHEERTKLIQHYAEKDENGEIKVDENSNAMIPDDSIMECNQKIQELLDTTIEVNADKIPMELLDMLSISPQQALYIENFLCEE